MSPLIDAQNYTLRKGFYFNISDNSLVSVSERREKGILIWAAYSPKTGLETKIDREFAKKLIRLSNPNKTPVSRAS